MLDYKHMKQITCVLFGRAGSGKGTQAKMLIEKLEQLDPNKKTLYIETGERLRSFMTGGSFSAKLVKETLSQGKLLGPFIPIWVWTGMLVDQCTGGENLVFDGVARRPEEAPILDTAMQMYSGASKPFVIHLDVPASEVTARLLKRGRYDDIEDKIAERLKAYDVDVTRSVEYFKTSPAVQFINVDGNQAPEKVHADIIQALGL